MVKIIQNQSQIHCQSEYGTLQKVVLCEPQYMEIKEVINDVQKKYINDNILTVHLPFRSIRYLNKHYGMKVWK